MSDDTILRKVIRKNYTPVSNDILDDNRMSYKAKGIMSHLLSRPSDWSFNKAFFINQSIEGKDSFEAGLKELEKCGYLRRTKQERGEDGKFKKIEWTIYEEPLIEEISNKNEVEKITKKPELKKKVPKRVFRGGKSATTNTEYTNTEYRYPDKDIKNDNICDQLPKDPDLSFSDLNEITVFNLDEGIFPDGSKLSTRTRRAFSKYNDQAKERLKANIVYFNVMLSLGMHPKKSYECMLQDFINKDYALKDKNKYQNLLYAQFVKLQHNLSNDEIFVMKTIVKINNDSIALNLPPDTFTEILDNFIKHKR